MNKTGKNQFAEWTEEQMERLRELAPTTPARELMKIFGRSKHSIRHKKERLGVILSKPKWTEEQLATLRNFDGSTSSMELALRIGKSYAALRKKAIQLKVSLPNKPFWNEMDLRTLMCCDGRNVREVMKLTGRSARGVEAKARELGIRLVGYHNHSHARKAPWPKPPKREVVTLSRIEYCPKCHAPVSNWQQHFERTGHRREAA